MRYLANVHVVDIMDQVHVVARVRCQEKPEEEWVNVAERVLDRKGIGEQDPLLWLAQALAHLLEP